MRAAVLHNRHDVRIEERADITCIPPHHVLVKVGAVGLCGSEIHYYEEGRIGMHIVNRPMVLGHEVGGVVAAIGAGLNAEVWHPGLVVALEPGIPCGICEYCKTGHYNFCPDIQFFATPPVDGALQDFITHPAAFTFPAIDLTVEEAALAEPLSVGVYAIQVMNVRPGMHILVVGGGSVGLLTALAAEAAGATVVVSEVNPTRVELGQHGGFRVTTPDRIPPEPYDRAIECSGTAPGIKLAQRHLKSHGQLALVGIGSADGMVLDGLDIGQRGLIVRGIFRYANTYPTALAILRKYRDRLMPFLAHSIAIDELPQCLVTKTYQSALKTMVVLP